MNTSFQGKRGLVTGGNKGIRFAIVQGLLAKGFDVINSSRAIAGQSQSCNRAVTVVKYSFLEIRR